MRVAYGRTALRFLKSNQSKRFTRTRRKGQSRHDHGGRPVPDCGGKTHGCKPSRAGSVWRDWFKREGRGDSCSCLPSHHSISPLQLHVDYQQVSFSSPSIPTSFRPLPRQLDAGRSSSAISADGVHPTVITMWPHNASAYQYSSYGAGPSRHGSGSIGQRQRQLDSTLR